MKAAVLGEKGVEVRDVPKPAPKPNEVLIKVRASSLNRADTIVAAEVQFNASTARARHLPPHTATVEHPSLRPHDDQITPIA